MRSKIIAVILICFSSIVCFSQIKYPAYIFGLCKGGYDGDRENNVIQFFSDSTFTLTNYFRTGGCYGGSTVAALHYNGRYSKLGDTLLLNDSSSVFYPLIKENNSFVALAKQSYLQLYPAKIVLQKNKAEYISYLGISSVLELLNYSSLAEIEKMYQPFVINHGVEKWMIGIKKAINLAISPQLSNKRNSF